LLASYARSFDLALIAVTNVCFWPDSSLSRRAAIDPKAALRERLLTALVFWCIRAPYRSPACGVANDADITFKQYIQDRRLHGIVNFNMITSIVWGLPEKMSGLDSLILQPCHTVLHDQCNLPLLRGA
jgi:hypothetical protein